MRCRNVHPLRVLLLSAAFLFSADEQYVEPVINVPIWLLVLQLGHRLGRRRVLAQISSQAVLDLCRVARHGLIERLYVVVLVFVETDVELGILLLRVRVLFDVVLAVVQRVLHRLRVHLLRLVDSWHLQIPQNR